jgi:hypothetical protein
MSARSAGVISALLFGMIAPCAGAGLSEFYLSASAFHRAEIITMFDRITDQDTDGFFRSMTPETGFTSAWGGPVSASVLDGAQGAHSQSTNVLNTDASGIELSSTVRISAALADGARSTSFANFYFDSGMVFDADTRVDVYLRIDFTRSSSYYRFGSLEIQGLEDAQTERLSIGSQSSSGYVETSYRALARAGEHIQLQAQIDGETDTKFGDALQDSGEFTVTAVVRAVPAPSGAGLFMGIAFFAARRRRSDA